MVTYGDWRGRGMLEKGAMVTAPLECSEGRLVLRIPGLLAVRESGGCVTSLPKREFGGWLPELVWGDLLNNEVGGLFPPEMGDLLKRELGGLLPELVLPPGDLLSKESGGLLPSLVSFSFCSPSLELLLTGLLNNEFGGLFPSLETSLDDLLNNEFGGLIPDDDPELPLSGDLKLGDLLLSLEELWGDLLNIGSGDFDSSAAGPFVILPNNEFGGLIPEFELGLSDLLEAVPGALFVTVERAFED